MVQNFRQAIIQIMTDYPDITKYRIAKELGMSTPTIINNVLSGTTKRPNEKFIQALYKVYGIKIKGEIYEDAK
jgi:transcriptional regulator with XRE-family HTH domain